MNKKRVAAYLFVFLLLLSPAGEAFVPKAPHLLYLVIEKIRQPVGIQAYQSKKILNYEDSRKGYTEVTERLLYAFPGRFRSDITSGQVTGFTVQAGDRFVRVADGVVVSTEIQVADFYTDILRYREYDQLLAQLAQTGVDVHNVMLKRYRDTVCYVIGAPPEAGMHIYSQLWVEKDTWFPVKYVVVKNGWAAEFYYESWQRVNKAWYPMRISIFLDEKLQSVIDVASFDLKKVDYESYFDVDAIIRTYPDSRPAAPLDETAREVNEIEEGLKDFGRMFE